MEVIGRYPIKISHTTTIPNELDVVFRNCSSVTDSPHLARQVLGFYHSRYQEYSRVDHL